MNIIISGLTAAGKTTHALLIARRLGYDYVSASHLMLSRLDVEPDETNTLWATRLSEVEKRRDEKPVDREVNDYLREQLRQRDRTVFDSWSAAWLDRSPHCLRVYIESDRNSRALKTRVSQEPHGPVLSISACRELIDEKDTSTAVRLRRLLGTDIRYDRTPFDLILDNSKLIDEPNVASARRGISVFHDRLVEAIGNRLGPNTLPSLR
ncbi:MAG TPA: cytidylate kinase family protein [Kribbella sp.]